MGYDRAPTGTQPAGTTSCEGGYAGLFDLSGNVGEWEDSCNGTTDADSCRIRGGSYQRASANLRCDDTYTWQRGAAFVDVGIRCCAAAL
jgi:formylglycine-generating enzyme required for sulfatase activity